MVFCYSDVLLDNFIIDDEDRIRVLDFEDAIILPSSFSKCVLVEARGRIDRDIRQMAVVQETEGVHN